MLLSKAYNICNRDAVIIIIVIVMTKTSHFVKIFNTSQSLNSNSATFGSDRKWLSCYIWQLSPLSSLCPNAPYASQAPYTIYTPYAHYLPYTPYATYAPYVPYAPRSSFIHS